MTVSMLWRSGSAFDPGIAESSYGLMFVGMMKLETIVWTSFFLGWTPNYRGFSKTIYESFLRNDHNEAVLHFLHLSSMFQTPLAIAFEVFGTPSVTGPSEMGVSKCCSALDQFDLRPDRRTPTPRESMGISSNGHGGHGTPCWLPRCLHRFGACTRQRVQLLLDLLVL